MADTVTTPPRQPRIFHGWYIVGIAVTAGMLLSGFQTYAFGFFFKPMSEELEIGRGATSAVLLIRAVIMGALALPIGMAVDRYGPRALMALGIILAALSTIGMAWVSSLLSFYLVFGVLRSLALGFAGGEVGSTVVAKWFVRHRALALAITSTGIPLGGIVMAPLAALLISQFDWRNAFVIFGVLTLVVLLVPSWLTMRRMPEDLGLRPDGELPEPASAVRPEGNRGANPEERDWTMAEAVRTPALWLITLSLNMTIFMTTSITLHQVPYLTDKGFSPALAASAIILLTTVALLVKFFWGWMANRIAIRYCIALSQTLDGPRARPAADRVVDVERDRVRLCLRPRPQRGPLRLARLRGLLRPAIPRQHAGHCRADTHCGQRRRPRHHRHLLRHHRRLQHHHPHLHRRDGAGGRLLPPRQAAQGPGS